MSIHQIAKGVLNKILYIFVRNIKMVKQQHS